MTQYLGICMVIIVVGLVLAVLAKLVTGNILDEFERIREKRMARKLKAFGTVLESSMKYTGKLLEYVKEATKMDEEAAKKGELDKARKNADEALKRTLRDMEYDLKNDEDKK